MPRELNEFFFPPALELNLSSFHFILSVFFLSVLSSFFMPLELYLSFFFHLERVSFSFSFHFEFFFVSKENKNRPRKHPLQFELREVKNRR